MNLGDFLSREAGQQRRQWLDSTMRGIFATCRRASAARRCWAIT